MYWGISWVHWGNRGEWCSVHHGFQHKLKAFSNYIPTWIMIFFWAARDMPHINLDIPLMHWTSSNLLKMSPWFTDDIPPIYQTPSSPMYSWYPPHESIMTSLWYTEHLPIYSRYCPKCIREIPLKWVPFNVLNTHCTGRSLTTTFASIYWWLDQMRLKGGRISCQW